MVNSGKIGLLTAVSVFLRTKQLIDLHTYTYLLKDVLLTECTETVNDIREAVGSSCLRHCTVTFFVVPIGIHV